MRRALVQSGVFDVGAEMDRVRSASDGGIGCFVGVVRGGRGDADEADQDEAVVALELEHYPGMTERSLEEVADEAVRRFSLGACTVIHRVGMLRPGDPIVLVLASAPHRGPALDATHFLIDWLKTRAPFWKREHLRSGAARWVEAQAADEDATAGWER